MDRHLKMITDYMVKHDITQDVMANKLSVTPATLSRWINEKIGLSVKNKAWIEFVCNELTHEKTELTHKSPCVNPPELDPLVAELLLGLTDLNRTDICQLIILKEKLRKHEVGAVTQSGEPMEVKRKAGFEGHRRNYVQGLHRVTVNA